MTTVTGEVSMRRGLDLRLVLGLAGLMMLAGPVACGDDDGGVIDPDATTSPDAQTISDGSAVDAANRPDADPNGPVATPAWRSGFETGFPGEWLNYDNGSWTVDGTPNPGWSSAWTIEDAGSFSDIPFGDHVYKGWVFATHTESHRAYPGIHCDIQSPMVNSFWVWVDVDFAQLASSAWVHLATWGNNPDWNVHTMSVRDHRLEMAHLDWSYIGPTPQPDFPLAQWVRLTAYIDYDDGGYIRVWQDGVPVLEGHYTSVSGSNLQRAHWGMYASGDVFDAVQYNDEIQIWTLDRPWIDLATEPPSPY